MRNANEVTPWHGCSPVNLLHIFRTPFPKYTSGRLLLGDEKVSIANLSLMSTDNHVPGLVPSFLLNGRKTQSIDHLNRFVLFLDNLPAQETEDFKNAVAGLNGIVWFDFKNATGLWHVDYYLLLISLYFTLAFNNFYKMQSQLTSKLVRAWGDAQSLNCMRVPILTRQRGECRQMVWKQY